MVQIITDENYDEYVDMGDIWSELVGDQSVFDALLNQTPQQFVESIVSNELLTKKAQVSDIDWIFELSDAFISNLKKELIAYILDIINN
jgi:hypothetical protein